MRPVWKLIEGNRIALVPMLRMVAMVLVVVLLMYNDARLGAAIYDHFNPPMMLLVLIYVLSFTAVIYLSRSTSKWVRTVIQVLVFTAFYTDSLYLILGQYPFSFSDAINIFNNPNYGSKALDTFKIAFLLSFVSTAVLYMLLRFSIDRLNKINATGWLVFFIVMQCAMLLYSKKQPGILDFLPSVYRVTGNLLSANSLRPEEKWHRLKVAEQPVNKPVKHLFLIVDESVAGNALSINGLKLPTTPFLQQYKDSIINFGIASSFTNFSAGSNLSLVSGMRQEQLPDTRYHAFSTPGIFQFAKKAGYRTYLLDAQTPPGISQNYTTPYDLAFIDSVYQPTTPNSNEPAFIKDSLLADKIALIAGLDTPTFVYVNKAGAHWPYHENYPASRPAPEFINDLKKKKNTADYLKSVWWNVDRFWEIVLTKTAGAKDVFMLYTSDHGENYTSENYRVKHASIYKTPVIEGLVPLLVVDRAGFMPVDYRPGVNRYSHEYIFPTLVTAMGYDRNSIHATYGRTLLDMPYTKARWFQSGDFFGRGLTNRVYVDPVAN